MHFLVVGFISLGIIISIFGRWLGSRFIEYLLSVCLFLSLFSNTCILYTLIKTEKIINLYLFTWIEFGMFKFDFTLYFDLLSTIMVETVLIISFLVNVYSIKYMEGDPHKIRFFFFLNCFIFFMVLLVLSINLLQFFLAWEGVGICSYLLISFWFTRAEAVRSALKAFILNKIGDVALLFSVCMIVAYWNCTTILSFVALVEHHNPYPNLLRTVGLFLFIAACAKSAQLGLHAWLPDAMEGPTPVSALLHAATMVTAGVYLLLRFSLVLQNIPLVLTLCSVVGGLTALTMALVGSFQNDIKKIIAYSTCSQLGFMFMACGTGNFVGCFYHLVNHAFFKALLFLGAGVLIHMYNDQDIRKMGDLFYAPLVYTFFMIGNLSLAGFFFFSGFYSKDFIIEFSYLTSQNWKSSFVFVISLITIFFTTFYTTRLVYYVFFKTAARRELVLKNRWMPNCKIILVPLGILAFFSIFSGYWLKDFFLGIGSDNFSGVLPALASRDLVGVEFVVNWKIKFLPFIVSLLAIWVWGKFIFNKSNAILMNMVMQADWWWISEFLKFFTKEKAGFVSIYYSIAFNFCVFSNFLFKIVEKGCIESLWVWSPLEFTAQFLNKFIRRTQRKNIIQHLYTIVWISLSFFFFYNFYLFLI